MNEDAPEPNSYDDFISRFIALQLEAKSFGIVSLVCLMDSDVLSGDEHTWYSHYGGLAANVGLAYGAIDYMRKTVSPCS